MPIQIKVITVITSYFTSTIDQAAWDVQYPDDVPRQCDALSCGSYYVAELGRRLCTGSDIGSLPVLVSEVVQAVLSKMLSFSVRKFEL